MEVIGQSMNYFDFKRKEISDETKKTFLSKFKNIYQFYIMALLDEYFNVAFTTNNIFNIMYIVQWGSEYRTFEQQTNLNSKLLLDQYSGSR